MDRGQPRRQVLAENHDGAEGPGRRRCAAGPLRRPKRISRGYRGGVPPGEVVPFLAFPREIRKAVYTSNAIESPNYQLRWIIKSRGHFPSDDAAFKLLHLALSRAQEKWTMPIRNWELRTAPIRGAATAGGSLPEFATARQSFPGRAYTSPISTGRRSEAAAAVARRPTPAPAFPRSSVAAAGRPASGAADRPPAAPSWPSPRPCSPSPPPPSGHPRRSPYRSWPPPCWPSPEPSRPSPSASAARFSAFSRSLASFSFCLACS